MSGTPNWFRTQWALCLLRVIYAGKCELNHSQSKNQRDHWTHITVHEGTLKIRSFTFDRTVTAGQSIILPPYRHCEYRSVDVHTPVVATESGFDVEAFLRSGNPLTRLGLPVAVALSDNSDCRTWSANLESCCIRKDPVSNMAALRARSWLELLLLLYVEKGFETGAFTVATRHPVPAWVQVMADRITNESPRRKFKPCALHRLSGFSRSHVNAAFKKYLGETPRQFLHRRRIQLAMQRLAGNPELLLSEVAWGCGYSTQALFNRHFRKLTGTTPGEFRRTHAGSKTRRGNIVTS